MRRAVSLLSGGVLALCWVLLSAPAFAVWTPTGGGDHEGADWTPANGTAIAGVHTNIGSFNVAAGTTVNVQQWNGSAYGNVAIEAQNINIAGTLSAAGAGYGGGGGGGGGVGTTGPNPQRDPCAGACKPYNNSSGGAGTRGGLNGGGGTKTCANFGTSVGGNGGKGGGTYGGAAGSGRTRNYNQGAQAGGNGARGGYAVAGGNGDTTTDESLRLGSGGGGGGGGACAYEPTRSSVGGSGGGGAGGAGGGWIKLAACGTLSISGAVLTNGKHGGNGANGTNGRYGSYGCDFQGSGGNGGSAAGSSTSAGGSGVAGYQNNALPLVAACFPPDYPGNPTLACDGSGVVGGNGGAGGHGAGGGLLLKSSLLNFTGTSGSLNGLGSGNDAVNGGTLKYGYGQLTGNPLPLANFGRTYQLSGGVGCFLDIGLRYQSATGIVAIAALPGAGGSTLQVSRPNGSGVMTTYGIALVPPGDPKASGVHVQTASGVRALRVYP